jgi:hypothetical protein
MEDCRSLGAESRRHPSMGMLSSSGSTRRIIHAILTLATFQLFTGYHTKSGCATHDRRQSRLTWHKDNWSSHLAALDDDSIPVRASSYREKFLQVVAKNTKVALFLCTALIGTETALTREADARFDDTLQIPLFKFDGIFCMNYTVNGNQYRGIVDTGSPFLIVPSVNTRIWGYTSPTSPPYIDSGLTKTTEIFGGQDYETYWKIGDFGLSNSYALKSVVFASVGEDIMRPPGGVFVGLIKYKAEDIRPTLLGQMQYSSIQFDALNKELILSKKALIKSAEEESSAVKMVDLRALGDPVYHYAAKVKSLEINGYKIAENSTIYAVFDTGTTGCVLSDDLMNDYETPNPIRTVRIILTGENGNDVIIESGATRDEIFVVTAAKIPWFTKEPEVLQNYFDDTTVEVVRKPAVDSDSTVSALYSDEDGDEEIISANIARRLLNEPQVVVIGLTFFKNKVLTIDIDDGRVSLVNSKKRA